MSYVAVVVKLLYVWLLRLSVPCYTEDVCNDAPRSDTVFLLGRAYSSWRRSGAASVQHSKRCGRSFAVVPLGSRCRGMLAAHSRLISCAARSFDSFDVIDSSAFFSTPACHSQYSLKAAALACLLAVHRSATALRPCFEPSQQRGHVTERHEATCRRCARYFLKMSLACRLTDASSTLCSAEGLCWMLASTQSACWRGLSATGSPRR